MFKKNPYFLKAIHLSSSGLKIVAECWFFLSLTHTLQACTSTAGLQTEVSFSGMEIKMSVHNNSHRFSTVEKDKTAEGVRVKEREPLLIIELITRFCITHQRNNNKNK